MSESERLEKIINDCKEASAKCDAVVIKAQQELGKLKEWPQKGDKIWFVGGEGTIWSRTYDDDYADRGYLKQGRVKRTKAEAEWHRDREQLEAPKLQVLYELKMFADEFNGDWKPDWNDSSQGKWGLFFNHRANKLSPHDCYRMQHGSPAYFKSEPTKQLREKFGDRLNILWGVE